MLPNSNLYKPKVLGNLKRFRRGEIIYNCETKISFMQGSH
jgi:hypothetical protein